MVVVRVVAVLTFRDLLETENVSRSQFQVQHRLLNCLCANYHRHAWSLRQPRHVHSLPAQRHENSIGWENLRCIPARGMHDCECVRGRVVRYVVRAVMPVSLRHACAPTYMHCCSLHTCMRNV
jgi:hypothetical protein